MVHSLTSILLLFAAVTTGVYNLLTNILKIDFVLKVVRMYSQIAFYDVCTHLQVLFYVKNYLNGEASKQGITTCIIVAY